MIQSCYHIVELEGSCGCLLNIHLCLKKANKMLSKL